MAHPLRLLRHRGLQVHHAAALGEAAAVLRQQYRAAPGSEHDARQQRERLDRLALALAEAGLAFLLEDERDVDPGAPPDLRIAAVEGQSESASQVAPHGRLGRAPRASAEYPGLAE